MFQAELRIYVPMSRISSLIDLLRCIIVTLFYVWIVVPKGIFHLWRPHRSCIHSICQTQPQYFLSSAHLCANSRHTDDT